MDQKKDRIKELFYNNPGKEFYLRQVSRLTKVPKTTVARKLMDLTKNKLIKRERKEPFDVYAANTTSHLYKYYKTQHIVENILRSGLIEHIVDKAYPKTIILFGSCAKGEFDKGSDIDLFVESEETTLNLKKFQLGRKINVFFSGKLINLSSELRDNILNGIKLYGMIRLENSWTSKSAKSTSKK